MTYADEVMNPQYFGSNLADIRIQIRMSGWMSGVHQTFFKSLLLQFFRFLRTLAHVIYVPIHNFALKIFGEFVLILGQQRSCLCQ